MKAVHLTLLLISAAMLAFQVALTRFFALAQGSHLAFMAVSLALLGAGASGTYLSLKRPTAATWPGIISGSAALFALSAPASYVAINYLPFDAYRIAWEPIQLLWLALYYLALTVPFFFSGLVTGTALTAQPEQAGQTYGANLLGSGLGPPVALLALATVGGPGTVFACGLLGWLAAGVSWNAGGRRPGWQQAIYAAMAIAFLYLTLGPPSFFEVRLTPYKSLSQAMLYPDSRLVFSRWNASSRVDVVRSDGVRSAPGLSFAYTGALPPQLGLTIDGDNLVPITGPGQLAFSQFLPLALGFELRPGANTLILEPGGGLAVLTALQNGAGPVTVVQSNPTVVEAVADHLAGFSGHLYNDPRLTLIVDEPRSFLRRSGQQFDLIILPLTDTFRPVTAGAYTLNEDYRYTVEAFSDALHHLSPGGLLLVERWLQLPPSESLRLWGTAIEAVRRDLEGRQQPGPASTPANHLIALRSLQTSLVGVARAPLSEQDLATIRRFATARQFDLIWLPDIQPAEANRYSIIPESPYYQTFAALLAAPEPDRFYAGYPYAIAPPTDDHPFFFHFFKWQQTPEIWQSLGKTWQPFGGSGYLVLALLLALVVVFSAALILIPLRWLPEKTAVDAAVAPWLKGRSGRRARYLLYFALLGLGFLFVEIPLLQRFILYLGQPAYAFAVVLSALLVASGLGSSYLAERLPLRLALAAIVLLAVSYPLLLPPLFQATLRLPFAGRVAVTVVALFPLGLFLGIPFPGGLRLVGQRRPNLTPWVWAVNGCASVISAVLAALIALTWSFSVVLWSAALAYALAGLVMRE